MRAGGGPFWRDADSDPALAQRLDKMNEGALGKESSFSASDRYRETQRSLNLKLPALLDYEKVRSDSHEQVKLFDGGGDACPLG